MMTSRKKKRGVTLVETLVAALISLLVMACCIGLLFTGSASWAQGLGKVNAEHDAQAAVRLIASRLSEAMSVSVAPSGQSVTYQLPAKDANGNFILPLQWDGVNRSMSVSGSQLFLIDGNSKMVIANGVILTDPLSGNGLASYTPFIGAGNPLIQQVTIEVATQWKGFQTNLVSSRQREIVYCRNIQEPVAQ